MFVSSRLYIKEKAEGAVPLDMFKKTEGSVPFVLCFKNRGDRPLFYFTEIFTSTSASASESDFIFKQAFPSL